VVETLANVGDWGVDQGQQQTGLAGMFGEAPIGVMTSRRTPRLTSVHEINVSMPTPPDGEGTHVVNGLPAINTRLVVRMDFKIMRRPLSGLPFRGKRNAKKSL
jgi:hypothetical protein